MYTCTKNGKERTNYITLSTLVILLFLIPLNSHTSSAGAAKKTWVVVIDPGHGGHDPGALGSNCREKDINLAIALKTGKYLEQNAENVKVLYTRDKDVFIGLKERAEFANKNKADLFISIHSNWAGAKNIRGAETFVMGLSKDQQNLEVAMKENSVILLEDDFSSKYEGFDPKSPESYVIFSLMQNVFQEQSLDLATKIQNQFKTRTGRIDRGVKQDGFWVLYMTSMPSVLVETGFITNEEEEKYLNSQAGQDYISSAIFRASRDYINELDRKSQISTNISQVSDTGSMDSETTMAPVESELLFMVQIASSADKQDLKPENFKGLKEVTEIETGNRYKYATGIFSKYSDAVEYRKKLESVYPDAFVIAVRDNKILPLQEALELKQEK